jgi:3-isopropylmalate/(R)-2-methylmalate dehydratase small subunit
MGKIDCIEGRALPLRGDDIDTDRIIPGRFLRAISFEGLEAHLFEDDRQSVRARGGEHVFDRPAYKGAKILLVNKNFGCGSSREHAPQALMRDGIDAVVGESFSEIFFGNATMLGMPCVTVSGEGIERLMAAVEQDPTRVVSLSVADLTVRGGGETLSASLPAASRDALLQGNWDPTALLLDRFDEVRAVAARLPYVRGF